MKAKNKTEEKKALDKFYTFMPLFGFAGLIFTYLTSKNNQELSKSFFYFSYFFCIVILATSFYHWFIRTPLHSEIVAQKLWKSEKSKMFNISFGLFLFFYVIFCLIISMLFLSRENITVVISIELLVFVILLLVQYSSLFKNLRKK